MDVRVSGGQVRGGGYAAQRTWGCLWSALAFCAALAGVVFFCAQAWVAAGPLEMWRVNGPFTVMGMPWGEMVGPLALALVCGALTCVAFLAGGARTGALAERRNPLLPRHLVGQPIEADNRPPAGR